MARYSYMTDDFVQFMQRVEGSKIEHVAYQDDAGVWTIGYGHTGDDVCSTTRWSEARAMDALSSDTLTAYEVCKRYVTTELTPNQEAAVISLIYNVGAGAFRRSKALKNLNVGDHEGFMYEAFDPDNGFTKVTDPVTRIRSKSAGLVNRRAYERALFLNSGN